jgi:hypothetical protein
MNNVNVPRPVPFSRSYWVVPGKLLAGYYPGDLDTSRTEDRLKRLIGAGIRYVINLIEENERNRYGHPFASYEDVIVRVGRRVGITITCVRRPTKDFSAPSPEYMRNILDEIDEAISQDKPVYIHCWGGKGRTGTVVGCYLVRHGYAQGQDVLDLIQKLRQNDPEADHPSPETRQQRDVVTSWQEGSSNEQENPGTSP